LTEEEFAAVSYGEPVIVQYGIAPSDEVWKFGIVSAGGAGSYSETLSSPSTSNCDTAGECLWFPVQLGKSALRLWA